jgi:Fe-Mn family superoxide dismutase
MITLPPLPYAHNALEPVMSATTLRTHHGKHHAKYVETANSLAQAEGLAGQPLEEVIRRAAMAPDRRLFNNAAQAWNHAFFWNSMAPHPSAAGGALLAAIRHAFGDPDKLREAFVAEGAGHFASGWVWLVAQDGRLSVISTHDADTVVTRGLTPLLVCDVWEHAYYLDHTNDRAGFLGVWWDRLANWDFAARQFSAERREGEAWTYPTGPDPYVPPIRDHGAFEHALEEAGMLLDGKPRPGSPQDRRFDALLDRLVEYQPAAADDRAQRLAADLDRRLRTLAERRAAQAEDHHWEPMLGGDLRPHG